MSSKISYKLLNMEVAPPADAWEGISNRLDAEFDAADISVGDKILNWEATPPSHTWDRIQAALETADQVPVQPSGKVVRFPLLRIAAAAVVLGIASLLTWNFMKSSNTSGVVQNSLVPAASTTTPPPAPAKEELAVLPSVPSEEPVINRPQQVIDIARRLVRQSAIAVNYAANVHTDAIKDIHCPQLNGLRAEQIEVARQRINGPLIKDAKGNVIIDEGLITTRDNCYIIITSPNGEQTRISAKFLPLLNDLNATSNSQWNSRFSEWRARLLQQASFIPSATNMLDIMELGDILDQQ